MVTGKNDRAIFGNVFYADHIDAPKKSVGNDTDQRNDQMMEHQRALLNPRSMHFAILPGSCQIGCGNRDASCGATVST
jgi:hypothetical protein